MLGLASCQNDFDGANVGVGGEVDFQLAVAAPEFGATRADKDGENGYDSAFGAIDYLSEADWANVDLRYSLEVYDYDPVAKTIGTAPVKDRMVKVLDKYEPVVFELRLVPGRHYHFVVFADFVEQGSTETPTVEAQATIGKHHVIGDTLADITLKNDAINTELTDAYFATAQFEITNSAAKDMILRRPYGKVRVVATDLAELNLNVEATSVKVTYTAPNANKFNAVYGTITGEGATTFEATYNDTTDTYSEYTVGYDDDTTTALNGAVRQSHMTLSTDYILATDTQAPIHFNIEVFDQDGNPIKETVFSTDIPVQRNYLTTVIGNVLTTGTEINVTINDDFYNADNIEDEPFFQTVWDGESIEEPSQAVDETGAPIADTYVIDQPSELAWLAAAVNGTLPATRATIAADSFTGKTFVLDADMDLGNCPWTPIGYNASGVAGNEACFSGTFDGNGHEIHNLFIDVKDQGGVGLFGAVNNATFKNFTLRNVYIKAVESESDPANTSGAEGKAEYIVGGHIGAVAGYDAAVWGTGAITFENVHVAGLIQIEGETRAAQGQRIAGIIGSRGYSKFTFRNVSVIGEEGSYIKGYCSTAGVIGQNQEAAVFENVTTDIDVYAVTFGAGGISGIARHGSTFTDCHTYGNVTLDASHTQLSSYSANYPFRVGGIAGCWSESKSGVLTLTNCSYEGTLTSIDRDGNSPEAFDYAGFVGRGYTLKNCAGSKVVVNGDEYVQVYDAVYGVYALNGVYEVNTSADLKALANDVNAGNSFEGQSVALTADIDLKNENWTPIGVIANDRGFCGDFDGCNHVIRNLTIENPTLDGGYAYAGLFGITEENTIKNLVIENVNISSEGSIVASVIAYPYYTNVENVTVRGDIKISGADYVAGILGYTRRCVYANGLTIAGNSGSYITGNYTVGGVIADIQTNGGLVADYSNFKSSGLTISANNMHVGGISGIIAGQTLNNVAVENVAIVCNDARKGIVSGSLGKLSAINNVTVNNVTGADNLVGATFSGDYATMLVDGVTYGYNNGWYTFGTICTLGGHKAIVYSIETDGMKAVSVEQGEEMIWDDSVAWAKGLGEGWSLASLEDLQSIYNVRFALNDLLEADSADNALFEEDNKEEDGTYAAYWTSTLVEGVSSTPKAYYMYFDNDGSVMQSRTMFPVEYSRAVYAF